MLDLPADKNHLVEDVILMDKNKKNCLSKLFPNLIAFIC